jgi:DNA repair protein RecO (recombination protein O)
MSTLKEGTILNEFTNIKKDLTRFSYFSYITELTSQVIKQNNDPKIFKLFNSTVLKIEAGLNPKVMSNILELKLLDFLGVPLNLTECVKCGSRKDIVTIDPDEGGLICKSCYTNELIYDMKALKMLRNYSLVEIDSITELKISDELIEFINRIISMYYDRYTGIYIHSKKFLEKIDNLNLK